MQQDRTRLEDIDRRGAAAINQCRNIRDGIGDDETAVRLPWTREISTRDEVREQLFSLLDRAMQISEP
jgi:hypothetical protein